MTKSASYRLDCCSSECDYLGARPDEPCWGAVTSTGDDFDAETGEERRRHACEGHAGRGDGEPYLAEPRASNPKDPR